MGKTDETSPSFDFDTQHCTLEHRNEFGYGRYQNFPEHGVYVSRIYIHPEHRGQGHARRMIDAFVKAADERGVPISVAIAPLKTPEPNEPFRSPNELNGDQLAGIARRRGFEPPTEGSVLMKRRPVLQKR